MLGLTTPLKKSIFAAYVGLWTASHLLVYASQRNGAPTYNTTSVVLLTELVKLIMALSMYLMYDGSFASLMKVTASEVPLFFKYGVPALLFAVCNNLMYMNLASFDPGTYNILIQMKTPLIGVVHQWLFSTLLNKNQWIGIFLIMLGCMCKESHKLTSLAGMQAGVSAWFTLALQMLCSCAAGVYNELLLKGKWVESRGVTTNMQNAFMYLQSIAVNTCFLLWNGRLVDAVSPSNVSAILTPSVLCIVAILSSVGLVTGFFLKHLDSVLKAVASALEVVFTMLNCCCSTRRLWDIIVLSTTSTCFSLFAAIAVAGSKAR
eukprot:TRINITY_DN5402_c0_g1_i3.p1 TRINITY_DN5402_c0_g1~~TRINITY_DN5402_c0_g1_i3.p1  ORF type:complete len:319 (+),score=32.86 TRINITY_DN5402_c0_g1_i3:52-1008(+)